MNFTGTYYFKFSWRKEELRYFRVDHDNQLVLQICVSTPHKKGIMHCVGIYHIAYISCVAKYMNKVFRKYCTKVTKQEFDREANKMINKFDV